MDLERGRGSGRLKRMDGETGDGKSPTSIFLGGCGGLADKYLLLDVDIKITSPVSYSVRMLCSIDL